MINVVANFFLNKPNVNMEFFKSIIGPKTIKALTDGIPKFFQNLLATKASASEHKDNKNDIPIIITIASTLLNV